jgi:uncharacterized protein YggL (DUF469 family)
MGDIINLEEYLNKKASEEKKAEIIDEFFDKMSEEEQIAVFMKALDNLQFSGSVSMEEIMSDLVKCFKTILKELKIQEVTEFTFVDYDYPRLIIINGKGYDLDGAVDKDEDAGAALYEIDALIGDLVCDFGMKCEQILKLIEKEIKK